MNDVKLEYIKKRIDNVSKKLTRPRYTLTQWRQEMCLELQDICLILGVSTAYFRQVRRGKTPPSKKIVDGIYNLTHGKVATRSDILG